MNVWAVSRVLLLSAALAGCERPEEAVVDQAVRPAKLFRVSADRATVIHEFVGRVEAAETVDLSFEVPGELRQLPVREGQDLPAGELVAALDTRDFELAMQEAAVQRRLAAQDLERKEALLQRRGISQSLVDDARALEELWSVRLAQAEERLADTRLTAPFDAVVARRYVDNRSRVQVGDLIVRLLDLNELDVVASVPAGLLATVTPDRVVAFTATFDFLPGLEYPLTYRENSGEANPVAQTYDVAFTMAPPEETNILPGMTARVQVELTAGPGSSGIGIPTTALLSEPDGKFFVWVFDPESSIVHRRAVRVGAPLAQGVTVEQGLDGGELVVAAGASQLQAGMRVRPLGEPVSRL
jgi:RND family efflux transporter MFP subunit